MPLADTVGGAFRGSLWLLYGAVSLLLLIACINIAALLLSRTARREREIALRVSLGASRSTIAGELFAETAVLVCVGATSGVLVAAAVSRAFQTFAPRLPRLEAIGVEPRMLLYSLASAVVVALLCGLLPAIRGARRRRFTNSRGRPTTLPSLDSVVTRRCARGDAVNHVTVGRRAPHLALSTRSLGLNRGLMPREFCLPCQRQLERELRQPCRARSTRRLDSRRSRRHPRCRSGGDLLDITGSARSV